VALYHVHSAVIKKGASVGGASGFACYIARDHPDNATQFARYLDPWGGREDLVAKGEGALPSWAKDAHQFWLMADRYERGGPVRPGTVARTFEIALPRELSPTEREELAADLRAVFFDQYPHSWALHNPIDPDGGEHPHLHVMLSERRDDGLPRTPKTYFARTATRTQDKATHGVRKDRSFHGLERLLALRAGTCTLINASLERASLDVAVTHESLQTQMSPRAPAVYTRKADKVKVEALRSLLQREDYPHENRINVAMWRFQKGQEGIEDISREAMVTHVHDRFWGTAALGVTQTTRGQGMEEFCTVQEPGIFHNLTKEEHAAAVRDMDGQDVAATLAALLAQVEAWGQDEGQGHGTRVRLWGKEAEQDRQQGLSW